MKQLATKHPVLFEIILIIAGFALAVICSIAGQAMYFSNEVNMAIGRILAGLLLLIVFHKCFALKNQFRGLVVALPALLFAVWNIAQCFITGDGNPGFDGFMVILALAPAIFEEVIFRGIFIHNLRAGGRTPMQMLIISALVFGAVHLTNIAGMPPVQVLVQVAYSVVVGLVFGAIYIRTEDLMSVIIMHFAIDFTSQVFPGGETTPVPMVVVFVIMMAVMAFYAFHICRKAEPVSDGQKLTSDETI